MSEDLVNYFCEKEDKSDSLYSRIYKKPEVNVESLRVRMFTAENTIIYHSGMIDNHERRITALEK